MGILEGNEILGGNHQLGGNDVFGHKAQLEEIRVAAQAKEDRWNAMVDAIFAILEEVRAIRVAVEKSCSDCGSPDRMSEAKDMIRYGEKVGTIEGGHLQAPEQP